MAPTDAHFLVTRRGEGRRRRWRPTINIGGSPNGTTQKVRLTGNWFVDAITEPGGCPRTWQSLTLDYIDWDGVDNVAWLLRDDNGRPDVHRRPGAADGTSLDPTPAGRRHLLGSDHLEYVGTDGQRYSASIEQFQAAIGTPTYSPSALLEAAPVTFSANDFEPGGSTGHPPTRGGSSRWGVASCASRTRPSRGSTARSPARASATPGRATAGPGSS